MFNKLFGHPKNNTFNQATEYYKNLRYIDVGSLEYKNSLIEIIKLCQLTIDGNNKDGDAHVLLANAYFLAAMACAFNNGYSFFLGKAAAVIKATKTNNMYIVNRSIAEKVYNGIAEHLSTQMPNWVESGNQLPTDIKQIGDDIYESAIDISSLKEIRKLLFDSN